jgi:hypothetical protein
MSDRFILAFAGSLSVTQDLMPMVDAIVRLGLNDVAELRVIGSVNSDFFQKAENGYFDTMIVIVAYMPHTRLMKYLQNTHILLHPLPKMDYPAIGSKFWDYMTLGKQILALEYQENEELQQILAESGRGKVLKYDDQIGIEKFILERYEFLKQL